MKKPAKKTTKHPGGRPTDYKPEYCELIIKRMTDEGITIAEFAAEIDVTPKSIFKWANDFEEFSYALSQAKTKAMAYWLKKGRLAVDGRGPFRENMFKWFMAVRFKMTDKSEPIVVNNNTNTQEIPLDESIGSILEAFKQNSAFKNSG